MTRNLSEDVAIGLLLVLSVIGILVWFFSSHFNGLSSANALDQAQIARHISLGHGYRTSVIRPLNLAFDHNVHEHSDRFYAPLHPLVTAIGFVILGRNDKSAAASSALFYVLTMVPLFLLAKGIFDWRVGVLSVIIFATSGAVLRYAISGLEVSLAACLFTLLLYAIYASISQDDYDSQPKRLTTRMALCGVIFGLCCLAHYVMAIFIVPLLLLFYFAEEQKRIKRVAAFLVGLILITAPWLGRNYAVTNNPFFTLQGYQLLSSTSDYPGSTVYRKTEQSDSVSPLRFLLTHPVQVAKKALKNLHAIYSHLLGIINPVIIGFLIVGIFHKSESPEIRRLRLCFYAMFILFIPVAALTTVSSLTFVIFIPVLIIFAIGCFMRHVDGIQFRKKVFRIRSKFIAFTSGHARGAVVCALVAVCAFPCSGVWLWGMEK